MTIRLTMLCLALLTLGNVARAEDLAPGLWELSLEAGIGADAAFQSAPVKVIQCLTKDDARDPSKVLGMIAAPGAAGCGYSEKSYVGDTFRFAMQCSGTLDLNTSGEVTFSATAVRGTITTSTTIDGKKVEFQGVIVNRRLGDC